MTLAKLTKFRRVYTDWPAEKCRPEILLDMRIPLPMSGLNPRTVMGDVWWAEERRKALKRTDNHCAACGVHAMNTTERLALECHERYERDGKCMVYVECVPLCHDCHAYIHRGLLRQRCAAGQVSIAERRRIMDHGRDVILSSSSGRQHRSPEHADLVRLGWKGWTLKVGDQVFYSKITCLADWQRQYSSCHGPH